MRAERRTKLETIKKKVEKYYGGTKSDRDKGRLAHTRTPCSCAMCGNPRKHFKKVTLQEMIKDEDFHEQITEEDSYWGFDNS